MRPIRLSEAKTEYFQHLRARRLQHNTIRSCESLLSKAEKEWGNLLIKTIDPSHVDRLFAANQWAPRTQNLYLSHLRKFFKWCRSHKYMHPDSDPTATWANARVPINEEKARIPVDLFADLLDAAPHPRDRAIVAIGLFTFLRGSEMALLRINSLDLGRGELNVYRVKTRDSDTLGVSSELAEEMSRWLHWYRKNQGTLHPDWYLLPSKNPDLWLQDPATRRLYRPADRFSSVKPDVPENKPYRAVQRAMRNLGIEVKGEGAHTLRRSGATAFATQLRSEGYDSALRRTASILGHRSTLVTETYLGWSLERAERNTMLTGKPMFPGMKPEPGLRLVGGSDEGDSRAV